ncbi:hypothetical protein IQ07DRAFT_677918 [Pyrenochaeta sp. DS3sAY3a]|nr:hypothetical protein IQ07DRAFT_677918 [Pyrenochaeta sp. DS3sAY3a]
MAPPRAPKKSSLTSLSATATRQGHRTEAEQTPDEPRVASPSVSDPDDEFPDQDPTSTPSASARPLEQLMGDMQRKRHAKRKDKIQGAYASSYVTAQDSISDLFDDHERKASSIHQVQTKMLHDLLAQKANIEARMVEKLANLQASYDAHSRDLQLVLNSRVKRMD